MSPVSNIGWGSGERLAQQWLAGHLGNDLDVVVDYALKMVLR
jgi:hypothetical protein